MACSGNAIIGDVNDNSAISMATPPPKPKVALTPEVRKLVASRISAAVIESSAGNHSDQAFMDLALAPTIALLRRV